VASKNDRKLKKQRVVSGRSGGSKQLYIILPVAVILLVAGAWFMFFKGESSARNFTPVSATNGQVAIDAKLVDDGQVHWFSYQSGGKQVNFFALKGTDGQIRTAFDACQVCYTAKKGYHQEGQEVVCNNCGNRFKFDNVNVITGGCNPIPIAFDKGKPVPATVSGGQIIINAADLDKGVQYF